MPESKKHRDHRELGQEMDLFSFHEIAPGAPFWHPKGMIIFRELEKKAREINDREGYDEISTPIMVKREVFEKSGHWEHYRNNMFWFKNPVDENETLAIKPMNCPESTYIYNSKIRSYRDLPLRLAEIGRLHRNELSGTLGGMFRVRQITMDDAHIYVRQDQAETEILKVIQTISEFYKSLGFETEYYLATRPDKALGEQKEWELAEKALENGLGRSKIKYKLARGEGAFYGPKIEAHIKDSQGRDWQLGTAQLDLVMLPDKFDLAYTDEAGKKQKPWVIHRAIFGSFERFIGILLEHFDGALPFWLSPVQVAVLTINEKVLGYAQNVTAELQGKNIRTELDSRNETIAKKIREAEIQHVPYILVVGEKEMKENKVAVRERGKGDIGIMNIDELIKKVLS
ncbi:threonine--tRNA ligase [Candidatus Giovannonibacteria bacterium RIFCSPLOWO2_12_FULL_44_25]|uniref:Threonine--tRNA ligase n=4 Tax=Parcubacteria group TaxID=1794811 RepID=A0A837IHD4_9BACT|nr:MAG: Threonine-tRNA ligase [Parcubacteria group bacterium GW2011_GWC1_44_10]KKT57333.1 MAG: Threonine-tRNA ligase [Candidatus Giovannonibacteria bacterium GW2011_GWB1_44_23]KKT59681.1 MAG: Threonine-tRNA ligase [Candidatus Giovannonibacteria bacterium GW2011_GWA1_44_25]KKU12993.1 MAG: Threonine-tRNA ligase [Candidatus Azambacteria bacterium GW2011_GWC2_45_7b]OGF50058.1 MAG: threonine--tRNA ligase [Candidatus Giovannonibacteria bacterium GWA2_45_15]OGF59107.1 MAG: threonine--tRNA ligase [Can